VELTRQVARPVPRVARGADENAGDRIFIYELKSLVESEDVAKRALDIGKDDPGRSEVGVVAPTGANGPCVADAKDSFVAVQIGTAIQSHRQARQTPDEKPTPVEIVEQRSLIAALVEDGSGRDGEYTRHLLT
jgi:hypothetical protein